MPKLLPVMMDGIIYKNVMEAASRNGLSCSKMSRALQNGWDEYEGHVVEYAARWELDPEALLESTFLPKLDLYLDLSDKMHYGGLIPKFQAYP